MTFAEKNASRRAHRQRVGPGVYRGARKLRQNCLDGAFGLYRLDKKKAEHYDALCLGTDGER